MGYELTELLNRCTREDAEFLISTIDSYVNFTDDKGLKELCSSWDGTGIMPLVLNHKIEREIRYLGSNDFAYMSRKMRGCEPAGVGIDEIIDDLCKLTNRKISKEITIEERIKSFCNGLVTQRFLKLTEERQRILLKNIGYEEGKINQILDKIKGNKEFIIPLIPLILESLSKDKDDILKMIIKFFQIDISDEALGKLCEYKNYVVAIIALLGTGYMTLQLSGPANRKLLPLFLYLGAICFRGCQITNSNINLDSDINITIDRAESDEEILVPEEPAVILLGKS